MQTDLLNTRQVLLPTQNIVLYLPPATAISRNSGEEMYWARLWPTALAMAAFIDRQPEWVRGQRCLELGAGLGLVSFTAARYAASVLASDLSVDSLLVMEKTKQAGAFDNVTVLQIDWAAVPTELAFEVILLSDVNYDPAAFASLSATLRMFLQQGKKIILGSPQRLVAKSFLQPFMSHCIQQHNDEVEGQAVSIFVLA